MRDVVHAALLDCLELAANDWEEHFPIGGLLPEGRWKMMIEIRKLVSDPETGLSPELVHAYAPTFISQYQNVMLRPLAPHVAIPCSVAMDALGR